MESPDPSVGPSSITETGALMCSSGNRTGRVPKDKRIVLDKETKDVRSKAIYSPSLETKIFLSQIKTN
jgi:ATP-dependent phosphoenolpyruvate carboxykinase